MEGHNTYVKHCRTAKSTTEVARQSMFCFTLCWLEVVLDLEQNKVIYINNTIKTQKNRVSLHCCNILTKNISFVYCLFLLRIFLFNNMEYIAHNKKTDFICHVGQKVWENDESFYGRHSNWKKVNNRVLQTATYIIFYYCYWPRIKLLV